MKKGAAKLLDGDTWRELEWYDETDPKRAAEMMVSEAEELWQTQDTRRSMNLRHYRLYHNRDLASVYETGLASSSYDGGVYLTLNVTQSCVDTLVAKISRSRPRVQMLTEKGDYSLRRNAKMGTQFIDGVFHANDVYNADGREAFRDGTLAGSGLVHVYGHETLDDKAEIPIDRVLPDEVLFDESQATEGLKSLRSIYRVRWMHRDTVRWKYLPRIKDKAQLDAAKLAIRTAGGSKRPGGRLSWSRSADSLIPVYEGWHLPSFPGAGDGRHVVAIPGAWLAWRPYTRARFPFAWFHWNRPTVGLFGRSLAEQLVPIQLKINELIETIDEGQRVNCVVRTYVQDGMVNEDHLTNLVGTVIPVSGDPARAIVEKVGTGASKELYDDLETWYKRSFEVTGVSMLSATAEKPQGISSAVALRELLDREDMRFSPIGQAWERFYVDIGELVLDAAEEMYGEGGTKRKLVVSVPGDKFVSKIDFGALSLDRNRMVLKPSPTSTLPTTPAGKREYAIELYQAGGITRAQFLEMLELPDTTHSVSLLTAALECVEADVELILEKGTYRSPEPYAEPEFAMQYALMAYLRARNEEVEPERLDSLMRYVEEAAEFAGVPVPGSPEARAQGALAPAPPAPTGPPVVDPNAIAAGTPMAAPLEPAPGAEVLPADIAATAAPQLPPEASPPMASPEALI